MKKFMIAAALTAFAASPAVAQQSPWTAWQAPAQYNAPSQAYMYAPAQAYAQPGMSAGFAGSAPDVVIENGMIVGQDPDANVRLQLRRDAQAEPGTAGVPLPNLGATF
jgi:hypothetical protein